MALDHNISSIHDGDAASRTTEESSHGGTGFGGLSERLDNEMKKMWSWKAGAMLGSAQQRGRRGRPPPGPSGTGSGGLGRGSWSAGWRIHTLS
ncbi:hypothetical protein EYF80_047423 [Liparis tanakae]|uniref:Uncharacterized protein n=1 Tax=Liparis tanakae TaxID=230148 RepID=A0A4Z2FNI4_9TELE|nr:hypothetical protein EYF80_047423 [Liparis tanakae]